MIREASISESAIVPSCAEAKDEQHDKATRLQDSARCCRGAVKSLPQHTVSARSVAGAR